MGVAQQNHSISSRSRMDLHHVTGDLRDREPIQWQVKTGTLKPEYEIRSADGIRRYTLTVTTPVDFSLKVKDLAPESREVPITSILRHQLLGIVRGINETKGLQRNLGREALRTGQFAASAEILHSDFQVQTGVRGVLCNAHVEGQEHGRVTLVGIKVFKSPSDSSGGYIVEARMVSGLGYLGEEKFHVKKPEGEALFNSLKAKAPKA